ncbi:HNH endonuclease [uncultured virus]|nr:HNH endonuclease [uncultured virus]
MNEQNNNGEKETWKDINVFSNKYRISNFGNVKNIKTNKILHKINSGGFNWIRLAHNSKCKRFKIDYLVGKYFVINDDALNKTKIKHMDNNLLNDNHKNLEWIKIQEMNNSEIWKDIKGYEDRYQISNFGNVKSLLSKKNLNKKIQNSYYVVHLTNINKIDKYLKIHRLVAIHFIENSDPLKKTKVDHIDNNKINNHFENLRWVTTKENNDYYQKNHKPKNVILQYNKELLFIKKWLSIDEIIKTNNYDRNWLLKCIKHNKIAYGFLWKYEKIIVKKNIILQKNEIFKNISLFEEKDFSNYEISNYGNVKNLKTKKFLHPSKKHDYMKVHLTDKKISKTYWIKIHKLVAFKFVNGKTNIKNKVNHIDKTKLNNYYKNLEWVTQKQNVIHSCGKKINQIDLETNQILNTFSTIREAYDFLGKNINGQISFCCQGKIKNAYGYKWSYI